MKWYLKVLRQYVNFDGRAQRTEFWMYWLFNGFFMAIAVLLDVLLSTGWVVCIIYVLATFLPGLAVTVRRLHDSGKSGWWALLLLVPYVGQIVIIVFMLLNGDLKPNRYGVNPRFQDVQTDGSIRYPEASSTSYFGNITDAEPVEIAGNREISGEANTNPWGIIIGFAIALFLLWGGLSGNLVLRGTESSVALVVFALLLLGFNIHKLVQYINRKDSSFGAETVSDETLALASLEYLQCPKCGSISFTALNLGGKNVVYTAKAIATMPLTYQCGDCKQRFAAAPAEADKDEILDAPCEVVVKRLSNMLGAARIIIVYLNGVKVNAIDNGKAISFRTCVKHNILVVTDHEGTVFRSVYRFVAEPHGRVQAFFNRKFL